MVETAFLAHGDRHRVLVICAV